MATPRSIFSQIVSCSVQSAAQSRLSKLLLAAASAESRYLIANDSNLLLLPASVAKIVNLKLEEESKVF